MNDLQGATSATERLDFIDSLRGFALFGVFWANLHIFSGLTYMRDEQRASLFPTRFDSVANFLEAFFIENKFMGLFSFLFGISFWLFLSRVRSRGAPAVSLFYRRIFWLFVIGLVHGWLFWCFDILRFYALWAVLLPLFMQIAPRRLLWISLATAILIPAMVSGLRIWIGAPAPTTDFDAMALAAFSSGSYREFLIANWKYDWYLTNSVGQIGYQVAVFGRLLLGLCVARALNLSDLKTHRTLLLKVILFGGLAGLIGNTIAAFDLFPDPKITPFMGAAKRLLVESGRLGLTLFYAASLALAYLATRTGQLVRLLAPIGQMALTWYLLQTAFGIWMFYGFTHGPALMGKLGPASLMTVAFAGFLAQLIGAHFWLSRFRFGPAEWLWRSLTYWRIQPFIAASPKPVQEQRAT